MSARNGEPDTLSGVVAAVFVVAWRLVWWAARWLVGVRFDPLALAGAWTVVLAGAVTWRLGWPRIFETWVGCRLRSSWRSEWVYRRRWSTAMTLFGLAAHAPATVNPLDPLAEIKPRVIARPVLLWVRSGRCVDRVLVRHRMGHEQTHWDIRTEALAQTFRAQSCQVTPWRPGFLWLTFRYRETLARTVPPLPVVPAGRLDLEAVPVGVTEDGEPWTLRLSGTHVLIGGCMGAGKSSVIWALLRGLADGIATGLVEVWAVDPKGGMELTAGAPMFRRYAYPTLIDGDVTAESMVSMVELLEDAARLMLRRSDQLRCAGVRKHTPTRVAPAVVVIVDELAYFTKYLPDPVLKKRAALALGVLLTQGRAPGVTVVGAIQDVRKEAVPERDLIPTRVALRLPEASQTDLILGDGAHRRGAVCDRIPESLPGVGYVLRDGQTAPTRVRASWSSDAAITRLAADHPVPPPLEVIDTTTTEDNDDQADGVAA
jgi:S-DNA-T family DNA segregation ATPase FtsK/SpoIIIE